MAAAMALAAAAGQRDSIDNREPRDHDRRIDGYRYFEGMPRLARTAGPHRDSSDRSAHRLEGAALTDKPVVLFVCVHNAGRSLAARVLLDHYSHGRVEAYSAGSEPADQLNPSVVAVLGERGLDPTKEFPKPLTDETARAADVIVTMGCGDSCPVYPGKRIVDWDLEDPAGRSVDEVRSIVDEIDRRVQALLAELTPVNWG